MSFISGTLGAVLQSDAQADATKANRKNVKDTNELNYRMFRESRGEGGNAILPMYLPQGTEARLAGDAVRVYDAVTGQPIELTLEEYNQIAASMQPAVQSGNQVINSIYSGQMEAQRRANLDPVLQARQQLAEADAAAIDLALAEEGNRINAQEAAKGYTGGGSFDANRMLQATIAARQQAARAKGAAQLTNAGDVLGLQESMNDLRLRSLDAPLQRTNQLIQQSQAPLAGLAGRQQLAQSALNWFKLNPGTPPQAQTFQAQANPSLGALIAGGAAGAGNAALNYWQNQQLINALGGAAAGYTMPTAAQVGAGAGAATGAFGTEIGSLGGIMLA